MGFASACLSGNKPSPSSLCKAVVNTCATLFPFTAPISIADVPTLEFTLPPPAISHPAQTRPSPHGSPSTAFALTPRTEPKGHVAKSSDATRRHNQKNTQLDATLPVEDAQKQSEEKRRRKLIEEAWEVFTARFVDDSSINWRRIRHRLDARPVDSDHDLEKSLQWLFGRTPDPFTRYLSPDQLEAMKGDIDGEMCGVGIIFNAERIGWFSRKRVVIKHVVRSSPAADAGLQPGDRITAIDMVAVESISFDEATARLLGKEGKKVLVSFRRKHAADSIELSVLLTRKRFEVPTVSGERIYVPDVGDIGLIQIREFASNTAAQTRSAVRELLARSPISLLVLDMRGNSGGLVDRAVDVAKVFLQRGQTVVRFVGRDGRVTTERRAWSLMPWQRTVQLTEEPIVVLVDADTASASELVAAALRDNCRAVLVGNSTFGKGSVQAIVPLSNGGGAAVTVARYKTPNDESIVMGKGLRPDLFKDNLGDDGDDMVKELFGRNAVKRYKWVVSRLDKCAKTGCSKENRRIDLAKAIPSRLRILKQVTDNAT